MLGELIRAVLERALESELTAHLGYERHERGGSGGERPERDGRQDGPDRGRPGAAAGAAGPGGHVRAACSSRSGPGASPAAWTTWSSASTRTACRTGTSSTTCARSTGPSCRPRPSRGSPTPCWRRSRPGSPGRWTPSTRSCSWTRSWSRSATTRSCRTSPPTSRSASTPTGRSTSWGSGWPAPRRRPRPRRGRPLLGLVTADLRNRGVRDVLIACVDGLAGFADAVTAAFPPRSCSAASSTSSGTRCGRSPAATPARSRRSSGRSTPPRPPRPPSTPSPPSPSPPGGRSTRRPPASGSRPGTTSRRSSPSRRRCGSCSTPPTASSRLNYQLRKVTKARGHFPTDDAVVKLLWLAIINIEDKRARERAARRRDRQALRPARPHGRGPARHGLARGPQRTRHRLPWTATLAR